MSPSGAVQEVLRTERETGGGSKRGSNNGLCFSLLCLVTQNEADLGAGPQIFFLPPVTKNLRDSLALKITHQVLQWLMSINGCLNISIDSQI